MNPKKINIFNRPPWKNNGQPEIFGTEGIKSKRHSATGRFSTVARIGLAAAILVALGVGLCPDAGAQYVSKNQTRIHTAPAKNWDGQTFKPLDLAIDEAGDGDYLYEMNGVPHRVYFPAWLDSPVRLMSQDQRCEFTLGEMSYNAGEDYLASPQPASAAIGDDTVVYAEAFEGVDVEYHLTTRGIKEFFVLKQRPRAPAGHLPDPTLDFAVAVDAGGLIMYVDGAPAPDEFTTDRSVELVDVADGETVFTLPAPYAVDAAGDKIPIQYHVQTRGNTYTIHTRTPYAWLADPARAYPVKIDPSATIDADYSIVLNDGSTWQSDSISAGEFSGVYRTGIDFDTTVIPDSATITKVELKIYIDDTYGSTNHDVGNMTKKAYTYHVTDDDKSGFWADADGNQYLSNSSGFAGDDSYHKVDLLSAAETDLQNQLGANWFSVGWTGVGETNNDGKDGHTYAEANPPQIIVTYTLPALTSVSNSPSPATVGTTATHTVAFTTADALPADGKIVATFPAGFNLSAVGNSDISSGTMDGSFSVSRSGQELTITRSGGSSQPAAAENIIIADITNTSTASTSYTVDVATQDSGGSIINGPTTSSTFSITSEADNGVLVYVDNSAVFRYRVWDGTQFGSAQNGPTLQGTDVVRHVASAVSDDYAYVGVLAAAYNTGTNLHSVYGTVWDAAAGQWINTTELWTFTDSVKIHLRHFNIVALASNEFVAVGRTAGGTLENAGWLAGSGWTVETALTSIGAEYAQFIDLVRRPGTSNILLCTTDETPNTDCRYYKGDTPYGTSLDVNNDWTSNTQIGTASDDPDNWDTHAFFDPTDSSRGGIVHNADSAVARDIRVTRFTVTDTDITYGNTADSAFMGDDYNKSIVVPVPGQTYAFVGAVDIDQEFWTYFVDVENATPAWTTVSQLEADNGMWATTIDINYHWAMEFDGTRGVLVWSDVTASEKVHFRRWTIGGSFEASEQDVNGSPANGYDHTIIARRSPADTDEIFYAVVNDDVDVSTVWWDGSADAFYTSGNKKWTEQATELDTAIEDSFHAVEFQFCMPEGLSLADHAAGQEPDQLDGDVTQTGAELFAFQLSNSTGSTLTQNEFEFQLSSVNGLVTGDFDNFYIYVDADGSGDIEGGETTKVCATEATTVITGSTGTITFSSCSFGIDDGETFKMILTGNLANLAPGDSFTLDLGPDDLTPGGGGSDCTSTTHWVDGSNKYHFRRKITIDKAQLGTCTSDLTDFPLLVTVTGSKFDHLAKKTGTAGHDIIFKDADGNQLDHEIEDFDKTTNNRLIAWVRVPTVYYDRDTVIWMYYGNNSVTAATENPDGVWDNNFKGVWHLAEQVTDEQTSGSHEDSTANNNGSQNGNDDAAGQIADGQDFEGTNDYVSVGNVGSGIKTLSFWIQADDITSRKVIDIDGTDQIEIDASNNILATSFPAATIYVDGSTASAAVTTSWHHVTITDSTGVNASALDLGRVSSSYFDGIIDEVRLSDTARTACWIGTEYSNQKAGSTLITLGSPENLNYNFRKKITINGTDLTSGGSCSGDLSDFPFLVTLTGNDFAQIEDNVYSDGRDIIFKDAAGVQLDHEIERFDTTTLVAWVRIPTLYHNRDTAIYLYYGNPSVTAATENPAGVWDSNYVGVWHLEEVVAAEPSTSGTHYDSTSYGHDGTQNDNDDIAGKIAGGQDFDGTDDYVDLSAHISDFLPLDNGTVSAWFKRDAATNEDVIFAFGETGNSDRFVLYVKYNGASKIRIVIRETIDSIPEQPVSFTQTGTIDDSGPSWHHAVITNGDGTDVKLYVDGVDKTPTSATNGDNWFSFINEADWMKIGEDDNDLNNRLMQGIVDEVRISDTERGACWIKAEYNNQNAPADDYTVGPEEGLNYQYRKKITVESDQIDGDCSADIPDFPLLVTLTGTDFTDIENDVDANGYGLNFKAEDDAVCGGARTAPCVLDHEIELYDETNDKLVAWVRIPTLDYNNDTVIYLHYGNPNVTASTANPSGVWDDNFVGVWHLEETVTDEQTSGTHVDSTGMNNGSQNGNDDATGRIADGQDFEGTNDYVSAGNVGSGIKTVSFWIQADDITNRKVIDIDGTDQIEINGSSNILATSFPAATIYVDGSTASAAVTTSWHHVTITDSTGVSASALDFGRVSGSYFDGMIDEVRVSDSVRGACWIGTEHSNQKSTSTLVSAGPKERWTFDHYKTITIDQTKVGTNCSQDLSDFPVMIHIDGSDFTEIANDVDADGFDIIFKDANGNQLAHEIEKYDETTDYELVAWVRVPRLDHDDDTVITIHYGNDDIDAATANPDGVWDNNFKGVWHLEEQVTDEQTSGSHEDSTANNNGSQNGNDDAAGQIADGQDFEGTNDYVSVGNVGSGIKTLSFWIQADDITSRKVIDIDGTDQIEIDASNNILATSFPAATIYVDGSTASAAVTTSWHHVTIADSTGVNTSALDLGRVSSSYFDGIIDEVRLSDTAREACWIETEYNNQKTPATFYSISSEQAFTTAISLLSFTATGENESVQVAWETASETGNLGFYLYRADSPSGTYRRITDQLIAGLNFSAEGRVYSYADTNVTPGQPYYYKLEDLDMDGQRTFHGPVGVDWNGAGAPAVAAGDPEPVPWEPGGEAGPVTVSAADEPVYKIMLAGEGLYRLTRDFLAGQSVALDRVDLSRVRLYHAGGEVAIWVHDENSDTVFDAGDHITFYALPVAAEYAKYSADNVYWLTTGAGENPVKRMAAVDSAPDGAALAAGFTVTVRREQDQYYYPAAPGADGYDRWLNSTWVVGAEIAWQDAGQPITFTLDTPGATGDGTLTVALLGTYNTDHQVDISVNGGPTQTFSWSGINFYEAVIEDAALVDGLNAISLTCKTALDALLLDWLTADYPRNFAAEADQLEFGSGSPERFLVTDFTSADLLAFDITDPENVSRSVNFQTGGSGPYSLEFTPPNAAAQDRTYRVLTADTLLTPQAVTADAASNLTDAANGADYILITHRNLGWDANGDPYAWLTDLLALRRAQGHRVTAVDLTDIYDEFAFGLATPAAIRDFLAYAVSFWTAPAPQYVLLVGDATYDYKDNWGYGAGYDVPSYTIFTREGGETVTDNWFAAVSGGDALPDLYIGRLPAATAAEAGVMTAKIVSYETAVNTKTWQQNILLVADNVTRDEEAVFENMNDDAAAVLPAGLQAPFKAYLDAYDTAAALTADIQAQINGGSLLVNYSGHASVQIWAEERIFDTGDVPGLSNAGRYPVIISMSCLSGYFAYPAAWNYPSLSEALMRAADKGAVGMLVPTGQTNPIGQHILNTALFEAIFTADIRQLGAAVGRANQVLLQGHPSYTELSQTFLLFGDPAMVLQVPLPRRPGGLSAQLTATYTVELAWNSALDSNGAAAAGYHLYRGTTAGGPYTRLNAGPLAATAYSDGAISVGATYYYVVAALDGDGDESVPSEPAGVVLTDSDSDGLYDLLEAAGCTAANLPDSDGDGLTDGTEDANRNGTVDAGETDPCDSDSDGDGLPDGWEAAHGLDPVSDSGAGGPDGDPDNDGWTNYQEYLSCTDPADAASVPGAPTVPALNYPANGDETATRQPWLSVSNAEDADCQALRYVFELYADALLTTLVAATAAEGAAEDDNTTAWQAGSLLNENAGYYWRARAYDGISYSDWMAMATFFVNTTPEAPTVPTVSAPPDASEVAVVQPTLEVANAADADRDALTYEFRVYADDNLAALVSSKSDVLQGANGTTAWQVAALLEDNTHYWWVVQATDDDGLAGGWNSAVRFFVNTANDAPTTPPGGSPADGAEVATTTPLLAALHATDADLDPLSYFFEIDLVDTFNGFELEQSSELAQQAGETTSWAPLELADNSSYYWRVRAFDGLAYGPWHSGSFFVNTANDAPGKPTIDHPGDLSNVATRQPTLAVKAAVDADLDALDYDFELYADAELTQPVTEAVGIGLAWQVDETLEDNRSYFWRAQAVDAHGAAGDWSATVSFFVNTANDPPPAPVLNNPISGGTDTSLTPILSVFNAADLDQDALSYEFELYGDADLSRLVSAASAAQGHQITSWSVSSILADGGIYYWRARAHDGQQPGSWMPTAVLEIHTTGADTQYEIASRQEIFAGSLDPQHIAVAAADSPILNTSVEIPPGALRDDCTLLIGSVTNPPALPRNIRAIGRVTEFGPSGLTFNVPVVIKLPYTAAALRQARVADPAELAVFYYDTSILAWVAVEIAGIDAINRLVSIQTRHFSMYTIGASVAEAASGGGGGGVCFIAAMARAEAAVFKTDWPGSSLLGLLALFGLLWLGRKKDRTED